MAGIDVVRAAKDADIGGCSVVDDLHGLLGDFVAVHAMVARGGEVNRAVVVDHALATVEGGAAGYLAAGGYAAA